MNNRSMTSVSAELVRNWRIFSSADACDRIADATGLEVCDRQRHQVTKQPGAELDIDAVRGVREQIDAQRLDARDALDQEGLVLGAPIELLIEAPAKQRRGEHGNADVERE